MTTKAEPVAGGPVGQSGSPGLYRLLAWLSPEVDRYAIVYRQCGLEYPHHQSPPLS